MKKLLTLVLAFVLLVSVVSMASAAVTVGGNLRVWYQNLTDDGASKNLSTFKFDRLALDFNADLGNNSGIKSEVQIRSFVGNTTNGIDVRADYAYFYQKSLFLANDEIDLGAFDPVPFKNGYSNVMFVGGLGDALKIGNGVGVIYTVNGSAFNAAIGIVDAALNLPSNDATKATDANSPQGFDYSVRFNYLPIAGLKVGLGYEQVANITVDAADNYDTRMVVDASYSNPEVPYSGLVEYATVNPTQGGDSKDTLSGVYFEGAYALGSLKFIAGRAINVTDTDNNGGTYGNNIFNVTKSACLTGGSNIFTVNNNYTVVGVAYPVTSAATIQADYVMVDDSTSAGIKGQTAFGIRLLTKF